MKYLKIHTLIWAIICLIILLVNIVFYTLYVFIRFFWDFKIVSWSDFNHCDIGITNYWDGSTYIDYTPMDTFMRYFNMFD